MLLIGVLCQRCKNTINISFRKGIESFCNNKAFFPFFACHGPAIAQPRHPSAAVYSCRKRLTTGFRQSFPSLATARVQRNAGRPLFKSCTIGVQKGCFHHAKGPLLQCKKVAFQSQRGSFSKSMGFISNKRQTAGGGLPLFSYLRKRYSWNEP